MVSLRARIRRLPAGPIRGLVTALLDAEGSFPSRDDYPTVPGNPFAFLVRGSGPAVNDFVGFDKWERGHPPPTELRSKICPRLQIPFRRPRGRPGYGVPTPEIIPSDLPPEERAREEAKAREKEVRKWAEPFRTLLESEPSEHDLRGTLKVLFPPDAEESPHELPFKRRLERVFEAALREPDRSITIRIAETMAAAAPHSPGGESYLPFTFIRRALRR